MKETCVTCKYFMKIKWTGSVCTIDNEYKKIRGNCKRCDKYERNQRIIQNSGAAV